MRRQKQMWQNRIQNHTLTIHNTYNKTKAKNETDYCKNNDNEVSSMLQSMIMERFKLCRLTEMRGIVEMVATGTVTEIQQGLRFVTAQVMLASILNRSKMLLNTRRDYVQSQVSQQQKIQSKKHEDWSGKHCPHRILDEKRWPAVQQAIIAEYARITKKPEPAAKGKKRVWVKEPKGLNIRTGGSWDTKVAFNLPYTYTAIIDYDQTKNGFVKVIWGDKEGWFSAAFDAYWFDKDPCTEYICQTGLNFRAGQDWNTKVVQSRKKGDVVRVIGQVNKWYKVVLSNGVVGYIPVNNLYLKKK